MTAEQDARSRRRADGGIPREWWLAMLLGGMVVVWLGTLFLATEEDLTSAVEPAADPPRYTVRNANWLRTDENGAPVYRVTANQILIFRDDSMRIDTPRIDGLGDRRAWAMRAPTGEVIAGGRELLLHGGVDIDGSWEDGRPLRGLTDRLLVDSVSRTLRTDVGIEIDGDGRRIRGDGMVADWDGEQVELTGDVRMQFDARSR